MKQLLLSLLVFSGVLVAGSANAQAHADVVVADDDHHPDFYYLPDIDMYYYIPDRQFVYFYDGHWVFSRHLPSWHHDYDFEHGRRVFVSGERPYLDHDTHYEQYRERHDNGHNYNNGHYGYNSHGNGHGNGHGNWH